MNFVPQTLEQDLAANYDLRVLNTTITSLEVEPGPGIHQGRPRSLEFRLPDPSCNPYLGFSAMLLAGLEGVINEIEPFDQLVRDRWCTVGCHDFLPFCGFFQGPGLRCSLYLSD